MGEVFPLETEGFHPPLFADLHRLSLSDSLGEAKNNAQMVVVITCVEIIIYHPAPFPPPPPPHTPLSSIPLPHRLPTLSLTLAPSLPPPFKTAAQPEASKAGFTQQSSSRENGCCFQVLFAHLSGGDGAGENGVPGVLVFNIILYKKQNKKNPARPEEMAWLAPLFLRSKCLRSESILFVPGDG